MREEKPGPNPVKDNYDFYRCEKCGRLITAPEEQQAFVTGQICPCGSRKYRPTNMSWYHWFLPRVWVFAILRYRGLA